MIRIAALAVVGLFLFATAGTSFSKEPEIITKKSASDVATTVERLQAAIQSRGARVFTTVDHAAGAETADLELRPTTLVVFGNPKLGTPLMQSARTTGLDLPLKVLVWQDADGGVNVSYVPPSVIARRHGIEDQAAVVEKMAAALDAITTEAAAAQ
jgi:uncharacterized protein (DUF302 family)